MNASFRSELRRYRLGDDRDDVDPHGPPDESVIGVSCFIVAPPYRGHRLAEVLLERVLTDAPGRGAAWVEGYPVTGDGGDDPGSFLGRRVLYERHGFTPVRAEGRQTVMRRGVTP